MKCDYCEKNLMNVDSVFFENGLAYNACSLSCFALLRTDVKSCSVEERRKNYE